jgi:uncharacterized membrane protein YphA (DoxX/SURF4 family)
LDSPKLALRTDAVGELMLAGVLVVAGLATVNLGDAFAVPGWLAWLVALGLPAVGIALWMSPPTLDPLASVGVVNVA